MAEKTDGADLVVNAVLEMTFTDGQTEKYRVWVNPTEDNTVWVEHVHGPGKSRMLGATLAVKLQTSVREFNEKW